MTKIYFRALTWGILPFMLLACSSQFFVAVSKPRVTLCFSALSIIVTILPGYALLFGKFGLPTMGITGMAWAITLKNYIMLTVVISYQLLHHWYRKFSIFSFYRKAHVGYLKQLFHLGFPVSIQVTAELLSLCFGTLMMGWLGQTALASFQIVMQLSILVMMLPLGLSQASCILIGQALGQAEHREIRYIGYAALAVGLLFACIVAIIYLLAPHILIGFFVSLHQPSSRRIIHIATFLLMVSAFSQLFDSIRNVATGALRGLQDTKLPMCIGILSTWIISLPIGYIFAFKLHWGPVGLRLGFMLGFLCGAIMILQRFQQKSGHLLRT